jgi:hypothetical protein
MPGLQSFPDGFQFGPILSHRLRRAERRLLVKISDKLAIVANSETKGNLSAKIPATLPLIGLDGGDTLSDSVPFSFGHGGQDGEHQLGDAVPGHVSTEINHMQADRTVLELRQHV